MIAWLKWLMTGRQPPKPALRVTCDADHIEIHATDGSMRLPWRNLVGIAIETSGEGPFGTDVFWVLGTAGENIRIPHQMDGVDDLLTYFQALPGFDDDAVVQAMESQDMGIFICWSRAESGVAEQE